MSSVVSIVGRPNVGKSTLFNLLVGGRHAIESDVAGTTRDRLYKNVSIEGYPVTIVDTGDLRRKRVRILKRMCRNNRRQRFQVQMSLFL